MTIKSDFQKIMDNPKMIFSKYSKYSYILIGVLILANYLSKVLGLSSTILMGSVGKLLGKSSKVGPSVTSKIAAEVENLAKQLNKNTPIEIVKDIENAAKLTKQLTKKTSSVVRNKVVELLSDISIDLEESEDSLLQPKQGRPSEAWKRVKKMVKDKKFKELIKEDNNQSQKPKGFFEKLFDKTKWADKDIKHTGGSPSYLHQKQLGFLFVALSIVHYLDYSSDCKNYETSDLFSSGLFTIITCMLIFILITKIGLYSKLHMMLKRRNIGVIADLIDGGLVFFIYNMIKNMRDVTGYNKCSISSSSTDSSDIINIQNYISSLEADIKALQDKIAEEKTLRETYQTQLEAKISERTSIVDTLNDELSAEISAVDSNYATITEKQENQIEALDARISILETKISDLVVSQAELQTLLETRISAIETTQLTLKSLIESNTSNITNNSSSIGDNTSKIEGNILSITELKAIVDAYETPVSYEERVAALEVEQDNILANIAANTTSIKNIDLSGISSNAAAIVGNTSLITSNTSNINSNTELIKAIDTSGISTNTEAISLMKSAISAIDTSGISTNTEAISLLESAINAIDTSAIETNTKGIGAIVKHISFLSSDISTNTEAISLLKSAIAAIDTSGIATNTSGIATNTSGISTNTSDIATNTSGIATNTSDIATNTKGIGAIVQHIPFLSSEISTNSSAITSNSTLITGLDTELQALKTRVSAIELLGAELDALALRVTALESTDVDFETRISALELLDHGDSDENSNDDRSVTICHKGNTMKVSTSALSAHIAHGDTLGSC